MRSKKARFPRVALASERAPKVEALRSALQRLARFDPWWSEVAIVSRATPSGVRDTPLNDLELQRGARQRALTLAARLEADGEPAWLHLGLEGGLHVDGARAWLRSWAFATDGEQESWGLGPSVELPVRIATRVAAGEDLSIVIDQVAQGHDLRSQGGTWGYVTGGMLTRSTAFELAVIAALARFFNPGGYG